MFVFKRRMNTEIESRTNENVTDVDVVLWNEVNICVYDCVGSCDFFNVLKR